MVVVSVMALPNQITVQTGFCLLLNDLKSSLSSRQKPVYTIKFLVSEHALYQNFAAVRYFEQVFVFFP